MISRFAQFLGIMAERSPGQMVLMPQRGCHSNASGNVHEGVLATMAAEAACSAMGGNAIGVALEFLSAAKFEDGGIVAEAVAEGVVVAMIEIRQGEKLIATGKVIS